MKVNLFVHFLFKQVPHIIYFIIILYCLNLFHSKTILPQGQTSQEASCFSSLSHCTINQDHLKKSEFIRPTSYFTTTKLTKTYTLNFVSYTSQHINTTTNQIVYNELVIVCNIYYYQSNSL